MSVIKFNYFPTVFVDPYRKGHYLYDQRPYIPIRLSYRHNFSKIETLCLLDSGADRNLFHSSLGESVGITIKKGKLVEHRGIGGISLLAYRHKIKLFVGTYSFETEADFSKDQTVSLLGRGGFFAFFKAITFKERDKVVNLVY